MIDSDHSNDGRRGYQALIQRIFRPFVDKLFQDRIVFKPRDFFGYEVGSKREGIGSASILKLQNSEDKIRYILAQNYLFNEYADIVNDYRAIAMQPDRAVRYKNNPCS